MQFTKEELYLISGACFVAAGRLKIDKKGDPEKFIAVAWKANDLIREIEKAESPSTSE